MWLKMFDLVSSSEAGNTPRSQQQQQQQHVTQNRRSCSRCDPGGTHRWVAPPRPARASGVREPQMNVALYVWKKARCNTQIAVWGQTDRFKRHRSDVCECLINEIDRWRADVGFCVDVSSFRCLFCHLVAAILFPLQTNTLLTFSSLRLQRLWIRLI